MLELSLVEVLLLLMCTFFQTCMSKACLIMTNYIHVLLILHVFACAWSGLICIGML